MLASLNHPNIAAIYGVEERRRHQALVLELVDGPTLADLIAQGPLPLDDALSIARQIADALEAAHERDVIHRDLKPANVKVRRDGTVKVLDFGLAKTLDDGTTASSSPPQTAQITTPAMTEAGMILGTAAYMSPEQSRGGVVDRRSDVWAFGCVFYEMLTGRRAFEGEDLSDTLVAVRKADPTWSALPPATPDPIRRLLRRCLAKDRKARLPDIGSARLDIDEALAAPAGDDRPAMAASPRRSWWLWVPAIVALTAVLAGGATWLATREPPPGPNPADHRARRSASDGRIDQQLGYRHLPRWPADRLSGRRRIIAPALRAPARPTRSEDASGRRGCGQPVLLARWSIDWIRGGECGSDERSDEADRDHWWDPGDDRAGGRRDSRRVVEPGRHDCVRHA